jgi:hypothetical protein
VEAVLAEEVAPVVMEIAKTNVVTIAIYCVCRHVDLTLWVLPVVRMLVAEAHVLLLVLEHVLVLVKQVINKCGYQK